MTSPIASTPPQNTGAPFGAAPDKTPREQLKGASKQFEAIFVRQMLAAARKTSFDDGGLFKSQALDTFNQMQDEKFADSAAQTGAFGLAAVIEAQLARNLPAETAKQEQP